MRRDMLKMDSTWQFDSEEIIDKDTTDIVFIFGDRDCIEKESTYTSLAQIYKSADIVGCSSGGNIFGETIIKDSAIALAISFDFASVKVSKVNLDDYESFEEAGRHLIKQLPREDLKHILIFSDGLNLNASKFIEGANSIYKDKITITGGLAGDGDRFEKTSVIANAPAKSRIAVAVGFYGDSLICSSGSYSGWDEFGITRKITRSEGNIVYEIDNESALKLYKRYLGEFASQLPASALRFPLSIRKDKNSEKIIRSVLSIDEENQSLIFAGDVPQGYLARLMKTDLDGLIDGSELAISKVQKYNELDGIGIVVSCIGRRMVLDQQSEEELEIIQEELGNRVKLSGFYSYGELAPFSTCNICYLHNQTLTVTVIYEKDIR